MKSLKNTIYLPVFIVTLVGVSLAWSSCSVDDPDAPTKKDEEDGIVVKNLDKNTETKYAKNYSASKQDGFVSYYAEKDDGSSASVTLDDPEGDGLQGSDVPLTDQDMIHLSNPSGDDVIIGDGMYTVDEDGFITINGKSTVSDEEWEIILNQF